MLPGAEVSHNLSTRQARGPSEVRQLRLDARTGFAAATLRIGRVTPTRGQAEPPGHDHHERHHQQQHQTTRGQRRQPEARTRDGIKRQRRRRHGHRYAIGTASRVVYCGGRRDDGARRSGFAGHGERHGFAREHLISAGLGVEIHEAHGPELIRAGPAGDEQHLLRETAFKELAAVHHALGDRCDDLKIARDRLRGESADLGPIARAREFDRPRHGFAHGDLRRGGLGLEREVADGFRELNRSRRGQRLEVKRQRGARNEKPIGERLAVGGDVGDESERLATGREHGGAGGATIGARGAREMDFVARF